MTIEQLISCMHYHVGDGNCPTELPELLEKLLERLKDAEVAIAELLQRQ